MSKISSSFAFTLTFLKQRLQILGLISESQTQVYGQKQGVYSAYEASDW